MDKELIMNNFLAATQIEDLGTALSILEEHNWDLGVAVNTVLPQNFSEQCTIPSGSPDLRAPAEGDQESTDKMVVGRQGNIISQQESTDKMVVGRQGNVISQEERRDAIAAPDMPVIANPWADDSSIMESCVTDDDKVTIQTNSTVISSSGIQPSNEPKHNCNDTENGEEPESEEYFSPPEDFELQETELDVSANPKPTHDLLIPPNIDDPHIALQLFTTNFEKRYGGTHPLFYVGSLSEVVKEALGKNVSSRKPLFIYLHHDRSILSNIFCSQLLCSESIVNYLSLNFATWAWDLTSEEQKKKLLVMVKDSFGDDVASSVENVKSDHLPLILVVCKIGGKLEVQNIIQGHTDLDSLMGHLLMAMEVHEENQSNEIVEEKARMERESVRVEQERRFLESLAADKLKEEKKMETERARLQILEQEEAERQRCAEAVSPEPKPDYEGKVSKLRFRCPNGDTFQRKFKAEESLRCVLNYLCSEGFPVEKYKYLTSFPRRDITQLQAQESLEFHRLYPQETIFVEEK